MKKILLLIFTFSFSHSLFSQTPVGDNYASLCGPIPAVCYPVTLDTNNTLGLGIFFVGLNQINNPSTAPHYLLEDFTCTDSTWLNIGVAYAFEVHTGFTYEETVTAWIDFSNDGAYDASEIVYHDSARIYMHQGFVTVPTNAISSFAPIRMRVASEYAGNPPLNACNDALYGQYEDYTIYYGLNIGINESDKKSTVTVYPNPFHNEATLSANSQFNIHDALLKIYNSMGALVREQTILNIQSAIFNRTDLVDGLYYYELRTNNYELIGKGKFVVE